jgi:hypothetical protein
MLEDLLREEVWLVDESLEASAQIGAVLGTRLARPDTFAITCGVLVTIDPETWRELYQRPWCLTHEGFCAGL